MTTPENSACMPGGRQKPHGFDALLEALDGEGSVLGRDDENTDAYIAALKQVVLPAHECESLSPEARRTELLRLMLRTDEGLPASFLRWRDAAFVAMLQEQGLATLGGVGRLYLTTDGRLVADEIAVGLM